MSILERVLSGLGAGLIEKGKLDAQKERDDILFTRELALKQVESQIADAASARDHQERMGEIAATGAETRRTSLFEGVVNDRRDANKATRDLKHDITIKGIDFSNDAKMEGLKHKYKLSEDQFSSLLQSNRDAVAAGTTIDRVVFSKDGQMQQVYKNGNVVSRGPTGAYNPGGTSDDLGDMLNGGGTGPSGAASASGAPSTTGAGVSLGSSEKRTKGIAPVNDFAPRYNAATPDTAPKLFRTDPATGKTVKIPLAEAMQMYRSAGSQ